MRLENDEVFNGYYQLEFDRIPFVFRFGRKRIKVMYTTLFLFFVAMCASWSVFYGTKESMMIAPARDGYEPIYVNTFDYRFLVIAIIFAVLVFLVSLWMVLSLVYERRAFVKATDLAARLRYGREQRINEQYHYWKLHNNESV